jgi:cupin fold WbuC family metalloprotein
MEKYQEINAEFLTLLLSDARKNERRRAAFDLRTTPDDTSQRIINALQPHTDVPIHRHEESAETNICLEGCLDVVFFREVENKLEEESRITLCPAEGSYGVQIPKGIWHTVKVFEESVIVEMKDGKYVPKGQ